MGLDTTHDCYHGGYSRFHSLRKAWAMAAGIPPLELMEGFYNPEEAGTPFSMLKNLVKAMNQPLVTDTYDALKRQVMDYLPIKWGSLKPDPLHILLCHSDCDGLIGKNQCAGIADSLERILPQIPDESPISSFRDLTQRWIDGLRDAASKKENVEFH